MQWTETLNRIIDYIEEHLTDEIENAVIEKIAGSSFYNIQRVFVFVFNMTIAEYIRCRRLSLAALDLLESNEKILDIALKYGYGTHESFSRAFVQFHGILPSDAIEKCTELKYCYRAEIEISAKAAVKIGKIKELPAHHILNHIKIRAAHEIPLFGLSPNDNTGLVHVNDDILTAACEGDKFFLSTNKKFSIPLKIDLTAKTDSKNLKLMYGRGDLILNWQYSDWKYKIDELMIHDIVTSECFGYPKKGKIARNTYIDISWIITKDYMALTLDSELRYYNEHLPYVIQLQKSNEKFFSEVGIAPAWGSTVTLKHLCIHEIE